MPRISKEKNQEYQRKWYKENKDLQIARNKARVAPKIQWIKDFKKDKSCIQCGQNHPAVLDFHHRNPLDKDRSPYLMASRNVYLKRIIDEVAKCDILCSNCHRILHWKEKQLDE